MSLQSIPEEIQNPSVLIGKKLLYFTSVFVSLGVFLFGYDQGVMSGIITGPHFKSYFNNPSRAVIGTMVAILEIGALASSLLVGKIGDIIGRRKTIRYGAIIFVIGGVIQTGATKMLDLIFGRIISGIGVGLLSTIVPVYQSEVSPPHNRGKLSCIQFTGNIVGYSSSVWVDYFCSFIDNNKSWRIPLLIQCIMGFLLFLGSFIIIETPRWLLDNDHDTEGLIVIADLHTDGDVTDEKAKAEYRAIKEDVLMHRLDGEKTYSYMWSKYKKRVIISVLALAFAQLNGINVISYYAPMVFEQAGWVGRDAILMTGFNSLVYILSTIIPWYIVDKWGRRPILLSGALVMGISLCFISLFMYLAIPLTPVIVVVFVVIFNAGFGYSFGPLAWALPPEILPVSVRSLGCSLSTATNWACNWLVGEMTPILQEWIEWRLYLIHALSCFISFVVFYYMLPETAGVKLEDMNTLFNDGGSTIYAASQYSRINDSFDDFEQSSFISNLDYQYNSLNEQVDENGTSNMNRVISSDQFSNAGQGKVSIPSQAALARQQALINPSNVSIYNSTSHIPSIVPGNNPNVTGNANQSVFIQAEDIEPPNFEDVLAFKSNDTHSIKGSIRRGSESVKGLLGKVFKKDTSYSAINDEPSSIDNHADNRSVHE
ncbi:glycerol proton symporter of the plasma membrane, subject to glucose-induced inactivation [Ascoidea rubescens DSM 1968]|uniref:Glycerol proton symporter of the plasma membrane, subject to glucose-induced inactivation n=1 Tax=Ascoidea rubescens DSM 1968 TaxID=1344418 RepID=A0A1D2VER1_9ASCO|nr:glycerol proton symporter of the plasma membrane, subject to glucose-induced inactivation [Ascoidea rubescens DSM 1968]ODV59957.1 glycerol proton symporter of the plasma membrane, subject to glucose-induced inactivation [Ascoidea rubescens DSM 1968]